MKKSTYVKVNGVRLHAILAGPKKGNPIILLHGFPEFWLSWEKEIEILSNNGFRVIVPDLRGFNRSDKPKEVSQYTSDIMAKDIVELIKELGYEKVALGGHDMGGWISWTLLTYYPELFSKAIILNCPHPKAYFAYVRTSISQMMKSWYAFFFRMPFIPEIILTATNFFPYTSNLSKKLSKKKKLFYLEAYKKEGAVSANLNFYRCIIKGHLVNDTSTTRVKVPVKLLWGLKDRYLNKDLIKESLKYCNNGSVRCFPNSSHWIPIEEPEEVSKEIINFCVR